MRFTVLIDDILRLNVLLYRWTKKSKTWIRPPFNISIACFKVKENADRTCKVRSESLMKKKEY